MAGHAVIRIVSGGQTGADRGALDAARALGIAHGGYCPRGRRAENGRIPEIYPLRETESASYAVRTERNVVESDGTLIVSRGPLTGGSALTRRLARARGRPCLHIELQPLELQPLELQPLELQQPELQQLELRLGFRTREEAVRDIRAWLTRHQIAVLNVAGPRESHCPGIAAEVEQLLRAVLECRTGRTGAIPDRS